MPRELRAAQPQTWRSRVIKVAAVVVQSTRRVVIRLGAQRPHWDLYVAAARRALAFRPAFRTLLLNPHSPARQRG